MCMSLDCGRRLEYLGKTPGRHEVNMQTTHRVAPGKLGLKPCCEATVLTTVPLCTLKVDLIHFTLDGACWVCYPSHTEKLVFSNLLKCWV